MTAVPAKKAAKKAPKKAAPETRAPAKPGQPGFDWEAEYPGEDVFVYTASDGTTVGLAALGPTRRPKPGHLRRLRHQPEIEQMWYIIEKVCSPAALAVSDEFDDDDYGHMFAQWSEWSGTAGGKS